MFDSGDEYVLKKKNFWKFLFRFCDALTVSRGPSFIMKFNQFIRYRIAKHISPGIEKGATINKGARIVHGVSIKYHGNAGIRCILQWGVHIGSNVMMGENCAIFTQSHEVRTARNSFLGLQNQNQFMLAMILGLGIM